MTNDYGSVAGGRGVRSQLDYLALTSINFRRRLALFASTYTIFKYIHIGREVVLPPLPLLHRAGACRFKVRKTVPTRLTSLSLHL